MNNYLAVALGNLSDDRQQLRQSISKAARTSRPALTIALEALLHEQLTNPSVELDSDIAAMLGDMGGDQASLESMVSMEGKTADVLYGIWRGIWGGYYANKDRKLKAQGKETWPEKKAREKREEAENKRLLDKEFKPEEINAILKRTFADKSWVSQQKLVDGDVSSESISLHIRNRDSWAGTDILGTFKTGLDNLKKISVVLLGDGVKYGETVAQVEKELNSFIEAHSNMVPYTEGSKNMVHEPKSDEDKQAIEDFYKKSIEKLKRVKAPSVYLKSLVGLPLPGGTMVVIKDWWSGVDTTEKPKGEYPSRIPALTTDQVVSLANMVIEQFKIVKEIEAARKSIEKVIYHDDGSPINNMYDIISESEDLYDIVCDQTPNDVSIDSLIEASLKACRAAFTYIDRSVVEAK